MSFHYLFIYLHDRVSAKRPRQPSQSCSSIKQNAKINISSTVFKAVSMFNSQYLQQALLTDANCWPLKTLEVNEAQLMRNKSKYINCKHIHLREHKLQPPGLGMEDKVLPSLQERKQNKNKSLKCREFWKVKITVWGKWCTGWMEFTELCLF